MKKVLLVLLLLSWPAGFPQGAFQSVSIMGERESSLDAWYRSYDHIYFNDELTANIIITRNITDDRFMALTDYDQGLYRISFNPKYGVSPKQERETLLHEMCHIRQMISGEIEFDDHGVKWQSCMHDLANKGAFENLW